MQTFAEPSELIKKFEELKEERLICIFTGVADATGKNWCPDCDVAKPYIKKVIEQKDCPKVLMGEVADRDSWCDRDDHLYKTYPAFKARGVPTMVMFLDG